MIVRPLPVLLLAALCTRACLAVEASDGQNDGLHLERYAVRLDGVRVAADSAVYLADDETIYVSSADLDAWGLKRPLNPAFERDGSPYYGLQTDLHLATAFDSATRELEIVAPKNAFVGQSNAGLPRLSPGGGAFLNYYLSKENGSYDFYLAGRGGVFQMRYLSTTGDDGLEFHRSRAHWYRLDSAHHTVLDIGEGTSNGGWLGVSAPMARVHWATDFSSDPTYVPHGPPSVSGVAATPSLLEVYVDNILELRRDVSQGPFTVRDLPSSAAHSDIVMVLTDANGNKTLQVARPSFDPDFLGKGMATFSLDAGIAHENVDLKHSYYRGAVFVGMMRYGLTDRLSGELYAESVNGENFADAGADINLGGGQTLAFRIGGGNARHSSEYRYDLSRGKFRIREQFSFNSLNSVPFPGMDFDNVIAQITEASELGIDFNRNLSMILRLNRMRDNFGSETSMASVKTRYRAGGLTFEVSPFYDFVRHRMSGDIGLTWRMTNQDRVIARSAVTTQNATSASLEYKKDQTDPNDPLSLAVKVSANRSQDRRFFISEELPWALASFNYQQQFGTSIYEPELSGGLAFVGGRVYPLRAIGDGESFGVVRIPGLRNVRVSVNSAESGRTNSRGDLMLRNLQPFRDNTIGIAMADLPLDVNIADPQHVVPAGASPLALTIPIVSRGGFTFNAVDERGFSLEPGGELQSGGARYPVGYNGRTYVTGLSSGKQLLTGTVDGMRCTIELSVPANLSEIPDIGRQVCRAQR